MCVDPVTAVVIGGTAISAVSQVFSGVAANQQGRYEQQVAANNASLEREAAHDAETRGKREELRKWNEISQTRAQQVAAFAANGFDTGFGTAASVADDTLQMGMQDTWTIRENANRETRGFLINAANYDASGRAARARGRNALTGSLMGAAGTVLAGAGQVMGMGSVAGGTPFKAKPITPPGNTNPFGGYTFG